MIRQRHELRMMIVETMDDGSDAAVNDGVDYDGDHADDALCQASAPSQRVNRACFLDVKIASPHAGLSPHG